MKYLTFKVYTKDGDKIDVGCNYITENGITVEQQEYRWDKWCIKSDIVSSNCQKTCGCSGTNLPLQIIPPSLHPSSEPSFLPSSSPSISLSDPPSLSPSFVSSDKTSLTSLSPSSDPTSEPISLPSSSPTLNLSDEPSVSPSVVSSDEPSRSPSLSPTLAPFCVSSLFMGSTHMFSVEDVCYRIQLFEGGSFSLDDDNYGCMNKSFNMMTRISTFNTKRWTRYIFSGGDLEWSGSFLLKEYSTDESPNVEVKKWDVSSKEFIIYLPVPSCTISSEPSTNPSDTNPSVSPSLSLSEKPSVSPSTSLSDEPTVSPSLILTTSPSLIHTDGPSQFRPTCPSKTYMLPTLMISEGNTCWRIQLFKGGLFSADTNNVGCANSSFNPVFNYSEFQKKKARMILFKKGSFEWSGSFILKEEPSVTSTEFGTNVWDEDSKEFHINLLVPSCTETPQPITSPVPSMSPSHTLSSAPSFSPAISSLSSEPTMVSQGSSTPTSGLTASPAPTTPSSTSSPRPTSPSPLLNLTVTPTPTSSSPTSSPLSTTSAPTTKTTVSLVPTLIPSQNSAISFNPTSFSTLECQKPAGSKELDIILSFIDVSSLSKKTLNAQICTSNKASSSDQVSEILSVKVGTLEKLDKGMNNRFFFLCKVAHYT